MTQIAMIGDLHFGVKGGDKHFLEFQVNYMKAKLKDMAARGIKTLYQLGDAVDNRKRSDTTVLDALIEVADYAYEECGITIVFLVGNHNTFYTDTNSVHNLNVLKHHPGVMIVEEHQYFSDHDILVLGWIHKNNHDELMQVVERSTAKYCLMHAEFNGFQMYNGIEAKGGMSVTPFRKFKKVYTGHYHTVSEDGNVLYAGSPYALTWMDYVDGTNRGYFILNPVTGDCEMIKNDPSETLFAVENYDPNKAYTEADFEPLKNKVVKFFVKDVTDTKHFDGFVKLVNGVSYIDRRIIDERELAIVEHSNIDLRALNLTPVKVIDEYVRAEAEANELNSDDVSEEALQLYNTAIAQLTKV